MTMTIDLPATNAALRAAAARTADLLGTVTNPQAPVPGLTWTVAELAAHIAGDIEHYTGFVTGERDPGGYLERAAAATTASERSTIGNALLLEEVTERDIPTLAARYVPDVDRFIAASATRPVDEPILTANGIKMTVPVIATALLGEQLVHGFDLARALGQRWTISRADALLVVAGAVQLLPDYVNREATKAMHVAYELRFRGGRRYRLAIDDGATIEPAGAPVDCWISADPAAFLLVGYGRIGQWGQVLRGRIMSGGRRPWLGLKFGALISSV